MSLHTYDFDVTQAPGPRLFLEEGVLSMMQQQQQGVGGGGVGVGGGVGGAAAATSSSPPPSSSPRPQARTTTSFKTARRGHNRLDAAALVAATDGGSAGSFGGSSGDAAGETFSARPYSSEFDEHPDLATTWARDAAFLEVFAKGFSAYRMGRWDEARVELGRTLTWPQRGGGDASSSSSATATTATPAGNNSSSSNNNSSSPFDGPPDGPSAALLRFMESHRFVAPKAWRGFRELTEK